MYELFLRWLYRHPRWHAAMSFAFAGFFAYVVVAAVTDWSAFRAYWGWEAYALAIPSPLAFVLAVKTGIERLRNPERPLRDLQGADVGGTEADG